ncbi:MAG: lipid-A-disaccharide synthase [Acidobacteria bacterium]|nr:lipid-A-disaccharide synthase [Acidobacteriota bacterium]
MAPPIPIFISAGEASGDLYGALLVEALSERIEGLRFFGCGGDKMRAAGCETVVDAHEITMVGLVEVIPGLPRVARAFRRLVDTFSTRRPALAVLIDFPDFNLRLAKRLKRAGVEVVYFIAPQVWAWRRGRLKTLRRYVDRLLCIFPFEQEFFSKAGVRAEFVGHPLIGRVAPEMSEARFRQVLGLPQLPLIALLPGSRRKEILLNLPPMIETARVIMRSNGPESSAGFVIPAASPEAAETIRQMLQGQPDRFWVVENRTYDAVGHSSAAIVASGTATIVTALLGTPMVVVYRVTAASWFLGRRLVRVPFYSMVNLVAGDRIVPEFIQGHFQPEVVAKEVLNLLRNQSAREQMQKGLRQVVEKLRAPATSDPASWLGSPEHHTPDAYRSVDAIARSVAVTESVLRTRFSLQTNV